jgi:hypothetical protein
MLLVVGFLSVLPILRADDAADPPRNTPLPDTSLLESAESASADAASPGAAPPREPTETADGALPPADPNFQPTEVERRILGFLDGDADSLLSPAELAAFPTPMRRWLDVERVNRDQAHGTRDFAPLLRRMLDDLRQGEHSVAAARRSSGTGSATPTAGAASGEGNTGNGNGGGTTAEPAKVDVPAKVAIEAGYAFGTMDQNPRDGKLQLEEWAVNYKAWLEGKGVKIPREMDKETFIQHYARHRDK